MFAYAGASTFPTIQADMKDRKKFNYSAIIAMASKKLHASKPFIHNRIKDDYYKQFSVLFLIYFPMASACYFSLGDHVTDNIVLAMSDGWERIIVEIMLLLHLVTAFPIITNPPAQFFEQLFNIPSGLLISNVSK